ncbi:hypothetical protein [Terrimonas sp.]|nr:hypothetical protein [Terrimonas sp.]
MYDYFIKDHLRNVRVGITDEYKQDIYSAATPGEDINTGQAFSFSTFLS